ncbi:unnamed protein product [Didymodactylos carnosus]|uniref:Uncharacterized protein n=4 Tax=Didymodactylos carnosus TaxID=1234261 RepID=A0A8S2GDH9_9BILA|nr:unnamed protein product [Didymodactylos carnosus]CAF4518301.1 unnamed protein product [Didymodactylos carnosus]
MSYMTNCNSTLLLNLNDGEYIQHWSISHRPFYLLKQWSMNTKNIILDVYLYSPNSLVMNILDVSSNYKCEIDFFDLYTMSRLHCISNDKFPICFEMKLLHQQQWLMKSDHHYFLYNEDRNEMEQIENNIDPNYMKILKLTQHEYVVLKCQDDMTTLEFYRPYF